MENKTEKEFKDKFRKYVVNEHWLDAIWEHWAIYCNYKCNLNSNRLEPLVMLTLANIKEEFPKWLVKIKNDAGQYRIFGYDFFNERVLVERSCGMEWIDLNKCKFISKGST